MRRYSIFLFSLAFLVLYGSGVMARTIVTEVPRNLWTKYGINPWKIDTDNDGFTDTDELQSKYCPTSADPIALTDKKCKPGRFNLRTGVYTQPLGANFLTARAIKRFHSCEQFSTTLSKVRSVYLQRYEGVSVFTGLTPNSFGISQPVAAGFSVSAEPAQKIADYSRTNVQVAGVDEGDILKTDGQVLYYLSQNRLIIASADPTVQTVYSTTPLDTVLNASDLYLVGSHVIVVGKTAPAVQPLPVSQGVNTSVSAIRASLPYYYHSPRTVATIIDVSNPENPSIVRSVTLDGNMITSRLTEGYLYLILNNSLVWSDRALSAAMVDMLPKVQDVRSEKALSDVVAGTSQQALTPLARCSDVDYLQPNIGDNFLVIAAIPVNDVHAPLGKKVVWGVPSGAQVYVSTNNLYVAAPNFAYNAKGFAHRTELYKFSFKKNTISFVASQTVPGSILNQFSMDEDRGLLRLATTENKYSGRADFVNHLIVLNDDLSRLSSVDAFSPTEKIYSVRFMGDRAYVVTFRQTDPFIVFDLKDPRSPQYLGELKIPGFSDYLHPYDVNHIIGIGKNTEMDDNTNFVWTEGLKLGMFDVTNPNIPTQMYSVVIGDRGSMSEALYDHHAFLFSKEKNLLAFPALIATFTDEQKKDTSTMRAWEYGRQTFGGLLVYSVDVASGFKEIGRISHLSSSTPVDKYGFYENQGLDMVKRSLYIGDRLYVVSDRQMTIHDLFNLMPLGRVQF